MVEEHGGLSPRKNSGRYTARLWGVGPKLVLIVVIIGTLFTLAAVAVQYVLDRNREEEQLRSTFDRIEAGFLPALSLSVFEFDTDQTAMLLKGITLSNEVRYARVEEKRGNEYTFLAAEGSLDQEVEIGRVYPLEYVYQGEKRVVGRLVIQADMDAISERVSERAEQFLLSSGLFLLLISISLVLIVHTMILRHLNRASRFVGAINVPVDHPPKLRLNRLSINRRYPDEIDGIAGALNDMTVRVTETYGELEAAKESLRLSASERGTLIRELYHRTKNNMQVIMSMLSLKAAHLPDDRTVHRFVSEMKVRIYAMALVHEKLYKSSNLTRINMGEYLHDLVDHIMQANGNSDANIRITLDIENIGFLLDAAIPCGLIVSELITNAIKHAFPGERSGTLYVSLRTLSDTEISLRVSDDGVGLPSDFSERPRNSMGVDSVYALGEEQLDGTVSFRNDNGSTCEVVFPKSVCCTTS